MQFSLQNNRGQIKGKINDVLDACDAVVVGFDDDKDIAVLKLMDESCYTTKELHDGSSVVYRLVKSLRDWKSVRFRPR